MAQLVRRDADGLAIVVHQPETLEQSRFATACVVSPVHGVLDLVGRDAGKAPEESARLPGHVSGAHEQCAVVSEAGFGIGQREPLRELRPNAFLDRGAEIKLGVLCELDAQLCCRVGAHIESVAAQRDKHGPRIGGRSESFHADVAVAGKRIVWIVTREDVLAGHVPARKHAGGLGDVANALQRVPRQRHERARDPARLRLAALRRIPAQAVALLAVLDGLHFAIVGVEPVQLGDAAVRHQEKGVRGSGNHVHWALGAAVRFPERGKRAFRGKFSGAPLLARRPDAVPGGGLPDGAGPDERPRDEAVIVEKDGDRLKLLSDAIRALGAVVGPACCGGSVEVVGLCVGNRLACARKRLVEPPYCGEHLVRVHERAEPVPVAEIGLEEVDVAGVERRVVGGGFRGLLQGAAPVHANRRVAAARHPGNAAQLPGRCIPVEAGAEDREVVARMADKPGEPCVGIERLRRPKERKLTHGPSPSVSRGNVRRPPRRP